MWFEAHDTLPTHPKTLELARLLKLDQYQAVGILWYLFSWGLTAADSDGTLPGMQAFHIARALSWPDRKADQLTSALVASGYLDEYDGTYVIHNWHKYAGKLMDRREADRQKMAAYRARKRDAENGGM